jgi:4'-phosphopantetheinyl transferase
LIAISPPEMMVECRTFNVDEVPSCSLSSDVIHVWRLRQSTIGGDLARFRSILSVDETHRADRFRFDKDRNQFMIARAVLRCLVGNYVGTDPVQVRFQFSDKGKPSLAQQHGCILQFNVAHSGDLILLAFSRNQRLGVDVEQIRSDFASDDLAERFFSLAERAALRELAAEQRVPAFFRCWTRKEAYIKATGDGLSLPLHHFDVSVRPDEPAQLLATRPDPLEATRWRMFHLDVDPGYAAALVAEQPW